LLEGVVSCHSAVGDEFGRFALIAMGCEQCKPFGPGSEPQLAEVVHSDIGTSLRKAEVLKFLFKVELFKRLPDDEHVTLANSCEEAEFERGQVIIHQGEMGNEFFVIKTGTAIVSVNVEGAGLQQVAALSAGDYFGENALLRDEPRTATITADTTITALKITREKFQELRLQEKIVFTKRAAVGGGRGAGFRGSKCEDTNLLVKTPAEKRLIAEALKTNANMKEMVHLDAGRIDALTAVAWQMSVPAGKKIITEGDLEADYFYIVNVGAFEVSVFGSAGDGSSADKVIAQTKAAGTIGPGGSFGELALLYFAPRAATITASVASTVWVIDRDNFKNTLQKNAEEAMLEYVQYIDRVEILHCLNAGERRLLAKSFTQMSFVKGDSVLRQGEKGDYFYVLYQGDVVVIKDGAEVAKLQATTKEAQVFGERALLSNDTRAATVTVTSETCSALALDRDSFQMVLGSLEDLKARGKDGDSKSIVKPVMGRTSMPPDPKEKIKYSELTKIGLLGCGGFGVVELVEHKTTKETYALKALSKGYVVKSGMQQSVMSEKKVQMMCDSPFVVKLYETFNSSQSLYLLLELALGGELYATYNRKGFYGSERHAKYYVSGTLFAFDHLHQRKIIFRDLKPENLLLTEKGAVKLTDMGLAKVVIGKSYTTCGTPDYFAPELIESQGHNQAVDWWTLGILTFELMTGHPPFESPSPMQIYQKVKKGINRVQFPAKIRGPCEDLVKHLCRKEPSERLPMKSGGIENVKTHKWFKDYDWKARQELTMQPPYVPHVKSPKDGSNFNARKEDMPPQVPYKDNGTGWDKDFATST